MENSNLSILIVEDDLTLSHQLQEYLEMFFHDIYLAQNGSEGYEKYKTHRPNIIITDINMPLDNGIEMIQKIRAKESETQIIVISAYTKTDYFLELIKYNLVGYLVKPIKSQELENIIVGVIEKLKQKKYLYMSDGFKWDIKDDILLHHDEKINLTNYEVLFIKTLLKNKNRCVTFVDIHYSVYDYENEYSQYAIQSLVKRLRKKIPQDLIKSCYKEGYKIEI